MLISGPEILFQDYYILIPLKNDHRGWSDSIAGMVLALHMADLAAIPASHTVPEFDSFGCSPQVTIKVHTTLHYTGAGFCGTPLEMHQTPLSSCSER